jgi:hypothetical protein
LKKPADKKLSVGFFNLWETWRYHPLVVVYPLGNFFNPFGYARRVPARPAYGGNKKIVIIFHFMQYRQPLESAKQFQIKKTPNGLFVGWGNFFA